MSGTDLLDLVPECARQFEDGPGPDHRVLGRRIGGSVLVGVEGEHPLTAGIGLLTGQLPTQVPNRQIAQVVGALVGADQIGSQRSVAGQSPQPPAARLERMDRHLRVVDHLGSVGVLEPGPEGLLARLVEIEQIDVCGGPGPRRDRQSARIALAAGPVPDDMDPDRVGSAVVLDPARHVLRQQDGGIEVEAALDLVGAGLERREQAVPQHPELGLSRPGAPPRAARCAAPGRDPHLQRDIGDEAVQSQLRSCRQVLAQVVTDLALNLVDVGDDAGEVAVLGDPLRGRLRADAGDPGQVVAGLADERGQVAVAVGRDEVLLLDGRRVHPPHLRDAPDRVEHGDAVADELERIAVPRADDDLESVRDGLVGQGRDDVVGLVALDPDVGDVERVEHLVQERDLPLELTRGRGAEAL